MSTVHSHTNTNAKGKQQHHHQHKSVDQTSTSQTSSSAPTPASTSVPAPTQQPQTTVQQPSVPQTTAPQTTAPQTQTLQETVQTKKGKKSVTPSSSSQSLTQQSPSPTMSMTDKQSDNVDRFEEQTMATQSQILKARELLKQLSSDVKKLLLSHRGEVKKMKVKKNKRTGEYKPTGFARYKPVTGRIADFIGVQQGTELRGPDVTSKVWNELKNRGLAYESDKRVLRVNEEVSKIFGVPMSVNNSTDPKDKNGFNFGNLQKYIKKAQTA